MIHELFTKQKIEFKIVLLSSPLMQDWISRLSSELMIHIESPQGGNVKNQSLHV